LEPEAAKASGSRTPHIHVLTHEPHEPHELRMSVSNENVTLSVQ